MNNLSERLANLSPEQRSQLLSRLRGGVAVSPTKDRPFVPKSLDLKAEVTLADEIRPQAPVDLAQLEHVVTNPTAVFVTGGTGFLGAFLIQDLLRHTAADVYCLTRANSVGEAKTRLQQNLSRYEIWQPAWASRIVPVLGDITQPLLGLTEAAFGALSQKLDAIYHSAAMLNYILPYSALKKPNVQGTQEILRLACQNKTKPVHYVSSVAVFESSAYAGRVLTEADPLDSTEGMFIGYSHSKWVAEQVMLLGRDRGIPITIHRASFISGDSNTGITNTNDFVCMMLKQCFRMGVMPDLTFMLDASPVDYVSRSIVYLSMQPQSIGHVFHLQHPQAITLKTLGSAYRLLGLDLRQIPYREWVAALKADAAQDAENPFNRLLPFFTQEYEEGLTLPELNAAERRPTISCEATLNALEGSGIVCPPPDARMLGRFLSYFIQSGFLELPLLSRLNPILLYVIATPGQKAIALAVFLSLVGLGLSLPRWQPLLSSGL
ncbi:MAG: NAD-dependent epimerase/dehydratase family protein [Synechococcales cyanobacterium CRU_2_2]|nr:NAD-dependent epimerase/dehydratase family protein [Synechococcales cyanobacterium CRU_2_2]